MGLAPSVIEAEYLCSDEHDVEPGTRTDKLDALELQESGYVNDSISLLDAIRSLACLGNHQDTFAEPLRKKGFYRLDITPAPFPVESKLGARFLMLAEKWHAETKFISSITEKILNSSYQQIIGMGPAAIPFILLELQRKPDHWSWALQSITGEQPAGPEIAGDVCALADAWIAWGKTKRFI